MGIFFVDLLPLILFFWGLLFLLSGLLFGVGYSLAPRRRIAGTILYGGIAFLWALMVLFLMAYCFIALLFSPVLDPLLKIPLFVGYSVGIIIPFLIVLGGFYDISCWYRDLLSERHQYGLLSYSVERRGNLTHIHIDTSQCEPDCVLRIAPILMFEQALYENEQAPLRSPARFIKGTVWTVFAEFVTHLIAWPRARRALFRQIGIKMGRDSHIALWTRVDPMLPDLIEFEDDAGVGVGCTLLTHSIIDSGKKMTFYYGPIKLGKRSRVGAKCVIMPGVTIGEGAIVAAGAVVTEDVPPWTIVGGIPARTIRKRSPDTDVTEVF